MKPDTKSPNAADAPQLPPTDHVPLAYQGPSFDEVTKMRQEYLTPSLITFYQRPIMLVEGKMQYVWDESGRRYLDCFGGIATVSAGHCHPHVVDAVQKQVQTLQHATTIYLHPTIAEYAKALTAKLPDDLSVCYFVNSGSEANDLALLMARLYTGNYDVIALRNAYHGGIASAMGLTAHGTWKYNVPHSFGVHHAIVPDPYRGPYGYDDPDAGAKYAADVKELIDYATPGRVAAYVAEPVQGVGGVVMPPKGYLENVYSAVREAGGLCISDEVQAGFGRLGEHFWGFEAQGVVPDIVTMAKSMGNGAPVAAVVTRREIAEALTARIHFNTFGGNPVSMACAKATLEAIENEGMQQNARDVGAYWIERLRELAARHAIIGDVRGMGLMIGVELVEDRATRAPASEATGKVLEGAKDHGLLIGKGGLRGNVLRIKPPFCVTRADADFACDVLDRVFATV